MGGEKPRTLAARRPVALYEDQEPWLSEQQGSRGAVLRELVDRARGTATPQGVHEMLAAVLAELEARGTWLRGSPAELLRDLKAGESTAVELVRDVVERMRER